MGHHPISNNANATYTPKNNLYRDDNSVGKRCGFSYTVVVVIYNLIRINFSAASVKEESRIR